MYQVKDLVNVPTKDLSEGATSEQRDGSLPDPQLDSIGPSFGPSRLFIFSRSSK